MDAKLLLCDFAEVSGGKLFVSGAGLALLASATPAQPYRVNLSLAILGLINLSDTDAQHKMTIELVYVTGRNETRVPLADELPEGNDPADRGMFIAYFVAPRSPQMLPGDEWSMPMAIPMFGLGLPDLGSLLQRARRRPGDEPRVVPSDASSASPGRRPAWWPRSCARRSAARRPPAVTSPQP